MRRFLRWLNRVPCGCTCTPDGAAVDRDCWRHAMLEWLVQHWVLLLEDGDYYHDARIEWRPWRWSAAAYERHLRQTGAL